MLPLIFLMDTSWYCSSLGWFFACFSDPYEPCWPGSYIYINVIFPCIRSSLQKLMYSRIGNFLKADLAKTSQRQIRTPKRGERTGHDLRCSICRSAIGQLVKSARAIVKLSFLWALSICQNWPAGPLPDQSVWKWKRLFPRVFAEKPSLSCILFRNWLTWLESFD